MIATSSTDRYRQLDVAAMTPAQRVVALYARLILALRQAKEAIRAGDIERREERLTLASEIIHELAASLDHERGGDLAGRLAGLYAWLLGECLAAHIRPTEARLDAPIKVASELHAAWVEAAATATQHSAA